MRVFGKISTLSFSRNVLRKCLKKKKEKKKSAFKLRKPEWTLWNWVDNILFERDGRYQTKLFSSSGCWAVGQINGARAGVWKESISFWFQKDFLCWMKQHLLWIFFLGWIFEKYSVQVDLSLFYFSVWQLTEKVPHSQCILQTITFLVAASCKGIHRFGNLFWTYFIAMLTPRKNNICDSFNSKRKNTARNYLALPLPLIISSVSDRTRQF